jgi:hypothetical protein
VSAPDPLVRPLDPQGLFVLLTAVHAQVTAALWISAGMICALAAIACLAFNGRRAALGCGFAYALTLCFVKAGYAPILGPGGCALAIIGLGWPLRSRTKPKVRP